MAIFIFVDPELLDMREYVKFFFFNFLVLRLYMKKMDVKEVVSVY